MLSYRFIALLFFLWFFSPVAWAHPVTYEDGVVLMSSFHPDRFDLHAHYSFSNRAAVAVGYTRVEDDEGDRTDFVLPRFNFLLHRWNNPGSQANLYLWGGPGVRWTEGEPGLAAIAAFQADYETRRIYTQFNAETLQSESDKDFNRFTYRVGVAPYLAEFDEVQTFLIAQVSYTPEMEDDWSAGPVIRVFYGEFLGELGVHLNGDLMATVMIHH